MTTEQRYREALERIANGYYITSMPRSSHTPKGAPQLPSETSYISRSEITKFQDIARAALSPTREVDDA